MNKSLWSFHHPQQLRSEKSCSFNRFKTDTFSSRRRLPSRVSLCLCVSLKTLVHRCGQVCHPSLMLSFLAGTGTTERNEGKKRNAGKGWKGRDAEVVLRHVFWNCLAWDDELLWRNTGTSGSRSGNICPRLSLLTKSHFARINYKVRTNGIPRTFV